MNNLPMPVIRLITVIGLISVLAGCRSHWQTDDSPPFDTVIENTTIIDAANGLRSNMTVVLRGDKIVAVGASKQLKQIHANQTIDGQGKYLIPGLWDSHVHITFVPELEPVFFDLLIANGITSVRDTGGQLDKMLAWRERARNAIAPSVYIAGPLIDGHPAVYNGEVTGFPNISATANTPAEVEEIVDTLASAQVDLLKAYEMLTPAAFSALLKRAAHHGLPVTGHVPLSMSAVDASNAGLRSMEHMRNLELDCASDSERLLLQRREQLHNGKQQPGSTLRRHIHKAQHFAAFERYDPTRCAAVINKLAQNDTWQVPTLTLMTLDRYPFYAEPDWLATFAHLPETVRKEWQMLATRHRQALNQASPTRDRRAALADWKMNMVNQLNTAGVQIMAGTDTPIFFLTPGFSLHRELETLVMAGLSPLQALESATLAPAKYFNLEKTQGLIAPAMLADLLLLDANPLDDIRNTTTINRVIKRGHVLDRAALDTLLQRSAELNN